MSINSIEKNDWDFITDKQEPNFEEKFNSLMQKYMENASQSLTSVDSWKKYDHLKKISANDTWLADLNLSEKDPKKIEYTRYLTFYNLIDNIGMMADFYEFYGHTTESEKKFVQFYLRMLDAQNKRKQEKDKKNTFTKLLTKLTGAVSGFKFKSSGINNFISKKYNSASINNEIEDEER